MLWLVGADANTAVENSILGMTRRFEIRVSAMRAEEFDQGSPQSTNEALSHGDTKSLGESGLIR